ncbi:MAG: carboxypeptidase regulatory-like domain-containing protein [Bacteroidales bacterium]|nr:carboxypeptidase regulatory-like domain-containing protein [Bacteroidales bacterium]
MKKVYLFIVLLLGIGVSLNTMAQRTNYGEPQKASQHQLNVRFGDVIYDQSADEEYGGYIVSQFFTDEASADLSSECADDFEVPTGETWVVGSFGVWGTWWPDSPGQAEKIDIAIYEDDGGMPGALIDGYSEETNFYAEEWFTGDEHESYYNFTFPTPLTFTEGHYWISFQIHDGYDKVGQWGWQDKTNTNWEPWHWRNPAGGFYGTFTDWTPSTLVTPFGYANDNRFALYGEAYNNDLAVLAITNPETGSLTATETVTITIKNQGKNTQTSFDVAYQLNGGAWVIENVGSLSLEPEVAVDFSFTATADLSATGSYIFQAKTMLAGDEKPANDTMTVEVVNYGEIYPMVNGDTISYTTCSGTFTDMGGVSGDIMPGDNGVITFYPGEAGKKIKLEFFGVWDISHSDGWPEVKPFQVFDGPDMNSPVIGKWTQNDWRDYGDKPEIIKALGETGAITIRYACPIWDQVEGWTALVSCYEQPADDFEVTAFTIAPTLIFTDRDITFTSTVRNIGSVAQSKDVTFYVNDNPVGTVNTGSVNPTESATVSYVHQFTEAGEVIIKAAVPEDSGDTPENNFLTVNNYVYLNGWFIEMFDDGYFPPEDWTPGPSWIGSTNPYSGTGAAGSYVETFNEDTLVTPKLVIHDGDMLTFYAATSLWWPGNLKVAWKNGTTGEWQLLEYIDLAGSPQYKPYQIDVSAAAGENYIGFINVGDVVWSWGSDVVIDAVIGVGIEFFYFDNDMKMAEFNPNPTPSKNTPINYNVTVKNNGVNAMVNGDYTVKIMQVAEGGDVEMASVPGIACASLQEKTHTLSVTFDKIGPTEVYAVVELPGDQKPDNNTSIVRPVYVQVNGTIAVTVADGTTEEYNIPSSLGQASGISEVIYPSTMINPTDITGFITGIAYEYNNINTAPTLNVPIEIWVGETELDDLTGGYINGSELTKVAEANIDLQMGLNQQLYIPFIAPYDYQGGNLCVLFFKPYSNDWYPGVQWLGLSQEPAADNTVSYLTSWDPPLDPMTIGSNPNLNFVSFTPKTTFYIGTVGTATLAGHVYDENTAPFEGVKIEVVGFENETYSAANGSYSFTDLLAWENLIRASQFGYYDNNQNIVLFQEKNNILNFNMELLPLVSVYGNVVGNDNYSLGLEGAEVTLTGYENYATTTDVDGNFSFENVYGAKTYTVTVTMPGYQTYTYSNVAVTDVDYNLYTLYLTELNTSPFYTQAEQVNPGTVKVNWNSPLDGVSDLLTFDYVINNGYTADIGEEVWLGNIYEMDPGTITQVSLYWKQYGETSGTVRLDLVDTEGNVFYSSEPFETVHDGWTVVDVPNITFEGGVFYAMAYWDGTNTDLTDYLASDSWTAGTGINFGYIMYEGAPPYLVSEEFPDYDFTFQIDVDIVTAAPETSRTNDGYNIFRGPYSDINNWSSWVKINDEPVMGNEYIDGEWPQPEEGYTYGVQTIYTTGTSEAAFSLPIVHNPNLPCESPWSVQATGLVHNISIPATADVNIFGESLENGDWIGVFYLDENGEEVCGGAGQWGGPFGTGGAVVNAYGNDPTTPEKDGFAAGETFRWRMHTCATWTEYPAGATYNTTKPNQGQFADFGLSALTSLQVMYCQYYSLSMGWNSISSYIVPMDADVETMFAPMVNELTILRNLSQVYWPGENVNTMGDWNSTSGYVMKVTEDMPFEICGADFASGELVLENAGWYYLPVPSECDVDAMALFTDVMDDIVIVQDLIGTQVFWPAQGVYTLETLTPGKAYKMKIANPITLNFPMCDGKEASSAFSQINSIETPWGQINMSPASQLVSFPAEALVSSNKGDMIGAFDQNNALCGYLVIDGSAKSQVMILFGDDATTIEKDGFTEGENISFRMMTNGEEISLDVEWDYNLENASGNFYSESLSAVKSITLGTTGIGNITANEVEVYPNPASDVVVINIKDEQFNTAEVTIIDTKGNVVLETLVQDSETTLNISNLESGIYFVKINAAQFNKIIKLVVR